MRMATTTAAPTRTFRPARGLVCALVCGAIGCTASGADVQPVRDALAFPTGMKVSPDGKFLFVVNANSELRFDSGSLDVVALDRVQGVIEPWRGYLQNPTKACKDFADGVPSMAPAPADGGKPLSCECDPNNSQTLVCEESYFINPNAGVRVGNFATDLSVQRLDSGTNPLRLFVPTRGDPSVAWADFDGTSLHCAAGSDPYPLCDDAHRLTSLYSDPDLEALPNEPFAVFADAFPSVDAAGNPVMHGFAMVTHLASGAVTLIDAPADSSKVQISDILVGVFGDPSTAARGATSIAALRPMKVSSPPVPGEVVPELAPDSLYVVSNTDNRVQQFTVGMRNGAAGYLLPGPFFLLDAVGMMSGGSSDSRAIQFSADAKRLYLVNRSPPSLQVWDTTIGPTGTPNNRLLGSSDLCREGSAVAVAGARIDRDNIDKIDNSNERVYVTCFQDGQIYVVNPFGQSQVEDIISVGRGPYTAVALRTEDPLPPAPPAPPPPPLPNYLFVSNFLEDTIAVIDITPDSPTRHRVVLRIGTPRAP